MVEAVTARAGPHKLTVIKGDAVEVEFPEFDVCVAKIPYGISSPLIAKLLFGPYHFRTATLLLQKEFAKRLMAVPGDGEYNRLAANVRPVAYVRMLMDVSKRDFVLMPRVDSSLVEIRPRAVAPGVDLHEWLAFTRVCFGQKNKTLGAIKQKRMVMELFGRSRRAEGRGGNGFGALDDGSDEDVSDKDDDRSDGEVGLSEEAVVAFKESIGVRRARQQEAVEAIQR